jgi:lipopolysaccharide/colanic/teichoic acid biosynthesis glycosyltransferase
MQQSILKHPIVKRSMDIAISALALFLLFPFLCLVALVIRLESKGNPLFFQERVGKDGKFFNIVKFRSMVSGADKTGMAWTQKDDTRITRIGKFIRSTSLDELPQLWNVLVGDMSLVGPRPHLINSIDDYTTEHWNLRHSVRPGITGMAQANGRSSLKLEQQIAYDSEYINNWSIAMDLSIILKTFLIVFKRNGVN